MTHDTHDHLESRQAILRDLIQAAERAGLIALARQPADRRAEVLIEIRNRNLGRA